MIVLNNSKTLACHSNYIRALRPCCILTELNRNGSTRREWPAAKSEAHGGALSTPQVQPVLVTTLTVTVEAWDGKDTAAGEKAYMQDTGDGGMIPIAYATMEAGLTAE